MLRLNLVFFFIISRFYYIVYLNILNFVFFKKKRRIVIKIWNMNVKKVKFRLEFKI